LGAIELLVVICMAITQCIANWNITLATRKLRPQVEMKKLEITKTQRKEIMMVRNHP